MIKRTYKSMIGLTAVLAIATMSVPVLAGPVGDFPPLRDDGAALYALSGTSIEDLKKKIPSAETVGLPVYPGSFYTAQFSGEGMLPSVILASKEPMEKIARWYEEKGLSWSDMFGMYYVGDQFEFMKSETVFLQDISADPAQSTGGLAGFDMSGLKTQITISYKPKQ